MTNRAQRRAAKKKGGLMNASHIPYAQRLKMQQADRIGVNRHHSARVAMFCKCLAIHDVKGVGYKKLVEFSLRYKEVEDEIYEDLEYGMDKAKRRLEQIGILISGDLYSIKIPGMSKRDQQVHDHALQSAQIAMIASAIAMNDVFGYEAIYGGGGLSQNGENFMNNLPYAHSGSDSETWKKTVEERLQRGLDSGSLSESDVMIIIKELGL